MKKYALLLGLLLSLSFITSCDKNDPGTVINNNTNNYNIEEKDFWEPTNGPYKTYVQKMVFDSDDNLYIVGQEPPQSDSTGGFATINLYKSQDYGKNWNILYQGDRNDILTYPVFFDQHLNLSRRSYRSRSIYISSDKGASWIQFKDSIADMQIMAFLGSNSHGTIFATSYKYDKTIYKQVYKLFGSTDFGKSWAELYSTDQGDLNGYIDQKDNIILCVPKPGSTSSLLQFFRSSDNGASWNKFYEYYNQSVFDVYEDNQGYLILNNTILSTDQGQTWKQIGTKGLYNGSFYKMSTNNKGNLYWASSAGLYRSTDKGDSWTLAIKSNNINSVVFDSKGYMYALMGSGMINRTKQPFE